MDPTFALVAKEILVSAAASTAVGVITEAVKSIFGGKKRRTCEAPAAG